MKRKVRTTQPSESVLDGVPPGSAIKPTTRQMMSRRLRGFARDESGTFTILGIFFFLIILVLGGIGVDLMRFERDRTNLQYTLDRAVLAAADLDQQLPATDVVNDYFDKAGLSGKIKSVTVEEGLGFRKVSATAKATMQTHFMHMSGVDSLEVPAASSAEERVDGVEISLILDVSGSMNRNSRLTNLKVAAKDFVDNMIDNSEVGQLSMSIIPYATQVSLPRKFADELTIARLHDYSTCINFDAAAFGSASINPQTPLVQTMHFDPWRTFDGRDNDPVEHVQRPVCESLPSRELIVWDNNRTRLKDYIQDMTARGNTSLDLGMKWGSALIDPSMRPVAQELAQNGDIPAAFGVRPLNYNSADVLKVIVLMTDGQNTSQYHVGDEYRTGFSDVWWNQQEEIYSVRNPQTGRYFWPHIGRWADHPHGQDGYGCILYNSWDCRNRNYTGDVERLQFKDLWAYTTIRSVWNRFYSPWIGSSNMYYDIRRYVGSYTKDARTRQICNVIKDKDVIVFTIGFEAPERGRNVLRDCASSPSHFYDVNGLEIKDAFASIASSIRQLRLTQ